MKRKEETLKSTIAHNREKEQLKKKEEELFNSSFKQIYKHVITNKEINDILVEKAKILLHEENKDISEQISLNENFFIELRKQKLARDLLDKMELLDKPSDLRKKLLGDQYLLN